MVILFPSVGYVVIKAPFFDSCPWRCQEFFDDISLVQEYVDVYPLAKSKMRQFGMELTKFSCDFQWSDAKPITFSDEEELELADFEDICGLEHTPIEERAKERTHIFVEKNRSEIYGWGSYIKTLKEVRICTILFIQQQIADMSSMKNSAVQNMIDAVLITR